MNFVWAIAILIASFLLTAALTPKPEKPKPAAFDDFDFPQFEEGTPQSVVFGDVWCSDWMVLWYGNYRTSAIKKSGSAK